MTMEESIEASNGPASIGEIDCDAAARDMTVDKTDNTFQQEQGVEEHDGSSRSTDGDIEMQIDGHDSAYVEPENNRISPDQPKRLRAIEVILSPPSDPDSYIRIPTSHTVFRVLEEFESDDETFYEIEFTDGRIEEASYDDVMRYKGGRAAAKAFESQNTPSLAGQGKDSNKRPRSDDEYEESGSDYGGKMKRQRARKTSISRPTRKSTRNASRQTSADLGYEDHMFDDSQSVLTTMQDDELEDLMPRDGTRSRSSASSSRATRVTRSRNPGRRNHATAADSDDELAHDHHHSNSDDDDFQIVRSDVAPQPRRSKRRKFKVKMKMNARRADRDSSIEFETTRRSGRSTKNLKNMKDPEIDEYDAVEERHTNAPKHAATKEVFQQYVPGSRFSKIHSETCESCQAGRGEGKIPLIHCQGCSFSYHKACIGHRAVREHRATKVGQDEFVLQCKFCIQGHRKKDIRAPNRALCQVCRVPGPSCAEFSTKKTPKQEEKARIDNGGEDPITKVDPVLLNNADNVLFRCANCKRGYHFDHLPALTVHDIGDEDVNENRLREYAMAGWNCKDCLDTTYKLHTLVAWRPLDRASYIVGKTNHDYDEDSIEYLIKWEGRSHFHDTWMPGPWVFGVAAGTMRQAFHKRDASAHPKMDTAAAIEEEWLLADVLLNVKYRTRVNTSSKVEDLQRIEDITSVFVKFQGLSYEEVVWDEPPAQDSGAPWDAFVAAYDEYLNGKYFVTVPDYKMRERIMLYRSLDFGKDCELKSQPAQLKKGRLMEYQMEGLNFLLYNFHQQQNVILADEMGLGKTIQIVAFISALTHDNPACWPFLVVVPNATCPNWRRELKQWAPDLRVVTYHGGKVAQDLAYRHELYPDGLKGGMKAHVVIMSYEAAVNVSHTFYGVKWVGLIVDEGQRLKNEETILYKSLQELKIPCRILLTGTPLQNNKRELFNLLQFIDASRNAEELDAKYAELTKDNLPELHSLIRPYFLRRTKAQVLKFLPPMAQIILPVTMTVVQEKLSKSIMARNPDLIRAIISRSKIKAGERKSMSNILSDLRQCLCHPFCFNSEIEDKTVSMEQMFRNLIEASPKLLLFELMLPKLKERGHRVLIFSQYLHCLTILEDFLTGLDMNYARIDGSLSALEKQKRIDAFNAPDSPLFVMLLSTRAGGVGINLATADTVIIYDPDFNPHQDIQALSRAHRIGQKRKVLCFQLMTKDTVEEKIMQMGRKKMALDHALIESMDAKEEASEDLESILKHGAAALFSGESKDKITYDHASIDKLLDRSQIENTDAGDDGSAETQFSFARIWANDKGDLNGADDMPQDISPDAGTSIWENILKEREAEHERELAANRRVYGRGARRRGTEGVDYKSSRVGFIEGVDDPLLTLGQPREADSGGSEIDGDDDFRVEQTDAEDNDSDDYGDGKSVGSGKTRSSKGHPEVVNDVPQHPPPKSQGPSSSEAPRQPAPPVAQLQTAWTHKSHPPQLQQAEFGAMRLTQPPVHDSSHNLYPIPSRPHSLTTAINPHTSILASNIRPSTVGPSAPRPSSIKEQTAIPGQIMPAIVSPPAVRLPNGDISHTGWIGGGNPCALCYRQHSTRDPCIDLNSQLSLRLALDRLRAGGDDPATFAVRLFFFQQLQNLSARRQPGP